MIIENPVKLFRVTRVKSQAVRRASPQTDQAAFQMALKIQHEIETSRANSAQERSELTPPVRAIKHYNLVDGRVMRYEGQRRRLDRPRQRCCWETVTAPIDP